MDWAITYFKYLGLLCLSILSIYWIGGLLVRIAEKIIKNKIKAESPVLHLFIRLVAALTVSITLFSLLITTGKTVNLLVAYVTLLFLWTLKKTSVVSERNAAHRLTWPLIFEVVIYGTAIYSLFALEIIRKSDWSSILRAQHLVDWGIYSVNVQTILQTGQENSYNVNNFLDPAYHGMTPYHYYEHWIGAILALLLPQALRMYLLSLIVHPILCLLALIASWIWLEEFGLSTRTNRLLAFLCLFTAGWFFLSSRFIDADGFLRLLVAALDDLNGFLMDVPKRTVVFSFLLAAILLIKNSHIRPGFIMLLVLPIFSVDSITAVFGGVTLYVLLGIHRKTVSLNDALFVLISYAIFAILFFVIYKAFGNHVISLYSSSDLILQTFRQGHIVIPFFFVVRAMIATVALYSFHIFILRRNGSEATSIIILLFFMLGSGLLGWALLFTYFDAIQFFSGFLTSVQTFLLILGITLIRKSTKKILVVYLLITTCYNFYSIFFPLNERSPYSREYLNEINKYKPISQVGISIQAEQDFSKQWTQRHVISYSLGNDYLIFMPQYVRSVEIGVFSLPETPFRQRPKTIPFLNISVDFDAVDAQRTRIMKESSIFSRFFNEIKKQNPIITIEEAQVLFIESHNIDWAILSKNVLASNILESKVNRTIVDPISGEKFLILKR